MGIGFASTWLRQVSPLLHKTTLTTALCQPLQSSLTCVRPLFCAFVEIFSVKSLRRNAAVYNHYSHHTQQSSLQNTTV